jgi:multidrug efflux pump subunit AcrB
MKPMIRTVVHNPVFANLLMIMVVVSGLASAALMLRAVLPPFIIETVLVSVPYPGAGPEEVEEGIALKIEEALEGIQGIKKYVTVSREGMAAAQIDVLDGEDVQVVKDRVADRINAIQDLPADAERPSVSELVIKRDTLVIALFGDIPADQLKDLARTVKEELTQLPDVSLASIIGTRDYEISIEVPERTLREYGLTLAEVAAAVRQSSLNQPGGQIRTSAEQINIRTMGRKYTGDDYRSVVVRAAPDGTVLTLGQIAVIRDEFTEDELITLYNGKPAVSISVYNSDDEDALDIAAAVREYLGRKSAELPDTVSLEIWANQSVFITQRIDMLIRNGRTGLLLVFVMLWFFLDLRLAFWISLGIPISLTGALTLMYGVGESLNMISLFAMIMVLGIVVDDAIVIGESIYVHRRMGKSGEDAAVDGTLEVAWPVVAAITTTIVAFVPLFFVSGIMGEFIKVIPTVVICALSVSLLEGLFILPAHLRDLPEMTGPEHRPTGPFAYPARLRVAFGHLMERFVDHVYRPAIAWLLGWRYVTVASAVALLLVTFGMIRGGVVKFVFFPEVDTSYITANVEFPEGTPIETTKAAVLRMQRALQDLEAELTTLSGEPFVKAMETNIGARIGMDQGYSTASGSHLGELRVEIVDSEDRTVSHEEFTRRWEEKVGPIMGALLLQIKGMSGGPPGKAVEVWLLGRDLGQLQAASDSIREQLRGFAGVYQVQDDFRPGKRELRVRLKPEARALGFTTRSLADQLRAGYYGEEVLRVQRGKDEVKVWVRYPREDRESLAYFDDLRVRGPDGSEVPLTTVAQVTLEPGYTTITRKDGQRRIVVSADVDNTVANANEVVAQLREGVLATLPSDFPGVVWTMEGEQRENEESLGSLVVGFPMALMGIYLIIATIFRSYIQPVIIMMVIPFGLIGGVFGHLLLGYELTIMSMFGMVALTGVVVNDAIVLIEAVNHRIHDGMTFAEAVVDGAARRFRPIILTSVTTVGGLAPLIAERSMQAQFLIPMGITIAAGVAFATVITLVLIPCLMNALNDVRRGIRWLVTGTLPGEDEVEPARERPATEIPLGVSPPAVNGVGAERVHSP